MEVVKFKPEAKPDTHRPASELVEMLVADKLVPPPHQRKNNAWPQKKRKAWILRLRQCVEGKAPPPLGILCIYQITEDMSQSYLNEGLQRIYAMIHATKHPRKYGFSSEEQVMQMLSQVFLSIQNRLYDSHWDAARDFKEVNAGVGLHPAEEHKYILVYTKDWKVVWEDKFNHWESTITGHFRSFCRIRDRRLDLLKRWRGCLLLFSIAFMEKPASRRRNLDLAGQDSPVEQTVRDLIEGNVTPDDVDSMLKTTVANYIAEIEAAWRKVEPDRAVQVQERVAQWLLGAMLAYPAPPAWWQTFLEKLLSQTGGTASLTWKDTGSGSRRRGTQLEFLSTQLSKFPKVVEVLGMKMPEHHRRETGSEIVKPGWHRDHIEPFADNGEGPTQIVPARQNAAKAARTPVRLDG